MSKIYHETFRQQLPIPLLKYSINNKLNLVIFSIDSGYEEYKTKYDIDVLLLERIKERKFIGPQHELYIVKLQDICNHSDICNFHDKSRVIEGYLYYNKIGLRIEGFPKDLFSSIDKSKLHKYIFYSNWIDPDFETNLEPEIIEELQIYSKQIGGKKKRKTKKKKTKKRKTKKRKTKSNKKNTNKKNKL